MHRMKELPSKKELLVMLWKTYSKQKQALSDSGIEVFGDIERMRGVFRAVLEGKRPDVACMPLPMPSENPLICSLCEDLGMYFSEHAYFRRTGPRGPIEIRVPGYKTCTCPVGRDKKAWLREDRRSQPARREEF